MYLPVQIEVHGHSHSNLCSAHVLVNCTVDGIEYHKLFHRSSTEYAAAELRDPHRIQVVWLVYAVGLTHANETSVETSSQSFVFDYLTHTHTLYNSSEMLVAASTMKALI